MTDQDGRHPYQRIADELRDKISSGELAPGDRLPSIPEMVTIYNVSDAVGRRVVSTLVNEGLVTAKPGSGTYVRERPERRRLTRSFTLRLNADPGTGSPYEADMRVQGRHGAWTYDSRTTIAPPEVRKRLRIAEAGTAPDTVCTKYVFQANGEPSELSTSWEPLELTKGTPVVLPEDGPHVGVMDRMRSIGIIIDGCTEEVNARIGTVEECAALKVPPKSIMFAITRIYWSQGRPVETADITIAAERYSLLYGDSPKGRGTEALGE